MRAFAGVDSESRTILTSFIWIFGLGGLGGILYAVFDGLRSRRSAGWPSTSGRVVESEFRLFREQRSGPHDHRERPPNALAHMRYEYHVAGRRYIGHRIRWTDVRLGESAASEWIAAYPVGRAVTVHYDPAAPQKAVLEPGAAVAGSCSLIVGGAFFLGIALVMRYFRGA